MAGIVKETVTTQNDGRKAAVTTETKKVATGFNTIEYLIYFLCGVLEILLAFRFVFKLTGANIANSFVDLVYGLTEIFISPFEGIFRMGYTEGIETSLVLEPSTLVAIIVYAVLAWGIVKLIRIFSGEKQQTD